MDERDREDDGTIWIENPSVFADRLDAVEAVLQAGTKLIGDYADVWVFASEDSSYWDTWRRSMTPDERKRISTKLIQLGRRFDPDGDWGLEYYGSQIGEISH